MDMLQGHVIGKTVPVASPHHRTCVEWASGDETRYAEGYFVHNAPCHKLAQCGTWRGECSIFENLQLSLFTNEQWLQREASEPSHKLLLCTFSALHFPDRDVPSPLGLLKMSDVVTVAHLE